MQRAIVCRNLQFSLLAASLLLLATWAQAQNHSFPDRVVYADSTTEKVRFISAMNKWKEQVNPQYYEQGGLKKRAREENVVRILRDSIEYRLIEYPHGSQYMRVLEEGPITAYRYYDLQKNAAITNYNKIAVSKSVLKRMYLEKSDSLYLLPIPNKQRQKLLTDLMPEYPDIQEMYQDKWKISYDVLEVVQAYNKRKKND